MSQESKDEKKNTGRILSHLSLTEQFPAAPIWNYLGQCSIQLTTPVDLWNLSFLVRHQRLSAKADALTKFLGGGPFGGGVMARPSNLSLLLMAFWDGWGTGG